jgi:succinate dehydrogenase / fumarate reductase, cytochrome b subunit
MTTLSKPFIFRRLHSLTGLFLVLFLLEHLLTNSQAALFIGEDGYGFIKMVNSIHGLPYLPFIEAFLLGVPFAIHMVWGIQYLKTGRINSFPSDGSTPALGEYYRNQTYTWQRITSWILLIGVVAHVVQMRFLNYPDHTGTGPQTTYLTSVSMDDGLYTLSERLDFELFDEKKIYEEKILLEKFTKSSSYDDASIDMDLFEIPKKTFYDPDKEEYLEEVQEYQQKKEWLGVLQSHPIVEGEVIVESSSFGTVTLLIVRDTFKNPLMLALYTVFVLAACFHASNGFWTFLITWGIAVTPHSQNKMRTLTTGLMCLLAFFGLASIWGTYWINLKY